MIGNQRFPYARSTKYQNNHRGSITIEAIHHLILRNTTFIFKFNHCVKYKLLQFLRGYIKFISFYQLFFNLLCNLNCIQLSYPAQSQHPTYEEPTKYVKMFIKMNFNLNQIIQIVTLP
jgi:hypothetical protein